MVPRSRAQIARFVGSKFEHPTTELRDALVKIQEAESRGRRRLAGGLAWQCLAILENWEGLTHLSPSERRDRFQQVAKKARELAKLIRKTGEIHRLNLWQLMCDYPDGALPLITATAEVINIADKLPHPDELLELIARRAEFQKQINLPVTKMKVASSARRTYFVLNLCDRLTFLFGTPPYSLVATVVSQIFDESFEPELVRKLWCGHLKKQRNKTAKKS